MSAKRAWDSAVPRGGLWYEVWSWDTSGPGFFADEYFSQRTGRYTTQASGTIFIIVVVT